MPSELPMIIDELTELLGFAATMRIVEAYGGVTFYVPDRVTPDHQLAKLVGHATALKLVEQYPRLELRIPRCLSLLVAQRNAEIRRRYDADESAPQLARTFNLTERHVRRILSDVDEEQDEDQFSLF